MFSEISADSLILMSDQVQTVKGKPMDYWVVYQNNITFVTYIASQYIYMVVWCR